MSDIKLKPCPLCQSPHVCIMLSPQQEDGSRFYYGFCYECCAEAGEGDTEAQAAEAWNALPRHLQWTTETPTEPGWYWYRRTDGGGRSVVMLYNAYLDGRMCVYRYPEKPVPAKNFCNGDVEWAGPIPEPKEQP